MGADVCSCLDNIVGEDNQDQDFSKNVNGTNKKPMKINNNPKIDLRGSSTMNGTLTDLYNSNNKSSRSPPPTVSQRERNYENNRNETRNHNINTSIDPSSINSSRLFNGQKTNEFNNSNINDNVNMRSISNDYEKNRESININDNSSSINNTKHNIYQNNTIDKSIDKSNNSKNSRRESAIKKTIAKKLPKEGLISSNFIHFFENEKGQEMALNINEFPNKLCIYMHKYLLKLLAKREFNRNLSKNKSEAVKIFKECVEKIYQNNPKLKDVESSSKIKYSKDGYKKYYKDEREIEKMIVISNPDTLLYDNSIIINYKNDNSSSLDNLLWIYKGQVNENNEQHGYGEFLSKNGIKKYGYWKNGELDGWGCIINPNDMVIIGYFKEGSLNGKGEKYNINTKSVYIGNFRDGLKWGLGEEDTIEGKYVGMFKNDKKNGDGKMEYKLSGDIYEGEFKDDLFEGNGHYIWKNSGQEYKGEYKNGLIHGKGLYEWSEGEYYRGDFVEGKKEGQGEIHWANGRSFIGPFKNGRPNGIGIFDNGINFKGEMEFIDGKMNIKSFSKNYSEQNTARSKSV